VTFALASSSAGKLSSPPPLPPETLPLFETDGSVTHSTPVLGPPGELRTVRAAAMIFRFRTALSLLIAGVVLWTTSCGTIIHPERIGQPRTGRLDWSIVLLDGIGLLLFFIPGVIAFIVDFATGAIYLPPGYADAGESQQWRVVYIPKDELTREKIQEVVSREAGRPINLDNEELRIERLRTIDETPAGLPAFRP
jgi:hypothetical protein